MMRLTFRTLPLRGKVTLATLAPLVIVLLIVAIAALWTINAWVVDEAQQQIRNDLNAAREVFHNEQNRIEAVVRFMAHSMESNGTLRHGSTLPAGKELLQVRQREGLDLLELIDTNGKSFGFTGAKENSTPFSERPFAKQVLAGETFSGAVLLSETELLNENPDLARKARILLRPASANSNVETRGMLLISAAPVFSTDGKVAGCLYGGILLNNNLKIIDRIRDVIYGADTGSATIFLGRTRATTTIRLENGERAIGTSVSAEVAEAVLDQGGTWLARAHVVDKWYLTAYEPIRDYLGQPVGALYVGLLEAPYTLLKQRATLLLLGLLILGSGFGYLFAHSVARRIARPITKLEESAERLASGERDVPLPEADDDEVGRLTNSFRNMTTALRENEEELNRLNRMLEKQVNKRTSELEEKNIELMRTQQELLRAEKLAAIGELASGVAHEINNPAAIIRGNIELLLAQLPEDHPAREEATEALRQTERVSRITQSMLTFAREQTFKPEQVEVNEIIEDVLAQVSHHQPLHEVEIVRELSPEIPVLMADGERLRQVFTNIVVNALQALDGQGTLRVSSRKKDQGVEVLFEDSGPGIGKEIQEKVFNPFFTTKAEGTGLGLSVSYGIIKALKGSIDVQSALGSGTTFRIQLPIELAD